MCSKLFFSGNRKSAKDFFKLFDKKIFKYKQKIFLVYVIMSISFEAIGFFKMSTFEAKLTNCLKLLTTTAIFVSGSYKYKIEL